MNSAFPKRLRLLRPREFERVFGQRCSAAAGPLVVYAAPNDLGHPRLGLTVSRKVGSAVARNRWKRLLREAFRLTQHDLPSLDMICLPRAGGHPDLPTLMKALPQLAAWLEKKIRTRQQAIEEASR